MLTRTVCEKVCTRLCVHTPGEYTRRGNSNQVPGTVTRITYLKTFCAKRINLVYSLNVSYLPHFSIGENMDPRILNAEPHYRGFERKADRVLGYNIITAPNLR